MKKPFGAPVDGRQAMLYCLSGGGLTAEISNLGATVVKLFVPDATGAMTDVVLGFDDPKDYIASTTFFGSVVGRNANRVGNATLKLGDLTVKMGANDNGIHNLHSGPDYFKNRIWNVEEHKKNTITLSLESPHGDQGFPGNAKISVRYTLENNALCIAYDAVCDQDTVFNLTNHSYFNLAGHRHPEKAMSQTLCMPARHFTPDDELSIPTGELRDVTGTPFDFRTPKAIGTDLDKDYDALKLQGGYDHNFEVYTNPCAVLRDPESGRTMSVETDCCGIQFYSGNFLVGETGKDGVSYCYRGGICLETQFYPDAVNKPQWKQPVVKAGVPYHSQTKYIFGY